jgi:hypothetical protein
MNSVECFDFNTKNWALIDFKFNLYEYALRLNALVKNYD